MDIVSSDNDEHVNDQQNIDMLTEQDTDFDSVISKEDVASKLPFALLFSLFLLYINITLFEYVYFTD